MSREYARHVWGQHTEQLLQLRARVRYKINEIVKLTLSVSAQSNYMAVAPVNGVNTGAHTRD